MKAPGERDRFRAAPEQFPARERACEKEPSRCGAASGSIRENHPEEDVQNSVETRGSPELVVYAAWAWAGGGGDSLPSWSSNFGKCR